MIIVEVAPVSPPDVTPPVVVEEYGFGFTLIGADGASWDLAAGPVFLLSGASGFGVPTPEHWWRSAPSIDGSAWKGMRTPQRELTLPIEVNGVTMGPLEWRDLESAVWNSIDPAGECQLVVTAPDSRQRTLSVRMNGGGDDPYDVDPMFDKRTVYSLQFTAGDPFWRGDTVSSKFEAESTANLFPGPPWNIGSPRAIGSAKVTNPGDKPVWPRWTITGPFTEATVGVGDALVTLDTPVPAGQTRIVDMDPRRRNITDANGVRKWIEGSEIEFATIPPGVDVTLSMSIAGAVAGSTSITLEFDPLYRRAFS